MEDFNWNDLPVPEPVLEPGGWYGPEKIFEMLLRSSAHHARAALAGFTRDDEYRVDAAVHAGVAVEHLAKAYLASLHPTLIADGDDFDSLLVLAGQAQYAKKRPAEIKTVSATELCRRVAQTLSTFKYNERSDRLLFAGRNAAIHLAIVDDTRRAVRVMARLVDPLLEALSHDRDSFWGSFLNVADVLKDEAAAEIIAIVEAKLSAAREFLGQRLKGLPEAEKNLALLAISGKKRWTSDHELPYECPVCHQLGWLVCQLDISDGDSEYPHGGDLARRQVYALPEGFECSACELSLEDSDELVAAGMPDEIDLGYQVIDLDDGRRIAE